MYQFFGLIINGNAFQFWRVFVFPLSKNPLHLLAVGCKFRVRKNGRFYSIMGNKQFAVIGSAACRE
jgi:hypothetical protein